MKKGIIKKSAFKKYQAGHPWLTADDLLQKNTLPNRPALYFLGDFWWLCSPKSFIRLRRFGPHQPGWMKIAKFNTITNADQFDACFSDWLKNYLYELLNRKIELLNLNKKERCFRWVFSENDLLPGLIVDVFNTQLVVQINSAPIETFWYSIEKVLLMAFEEKFNEKPVLHILRNAKVRLHEGLEVITPQQDNSPPSRSIYWNGFYWQMTPAQAQKTGAYFDQRENHKKAAHYARIKGYRQAWDLCSYQGGFSLHLLSAGLSVTAVDQSQPALNMAIENVRSNQLNEKKFQTTCADVFSWLAEATQNQFAKADMIVLDPPSFVKSRTEIQSALRGYTELNTLALQCLRPGGMLVSCACSHHISREMFSTSLKNAAKNAKCKIQILEVSGPSPDHSPALEFSQGHYLQAWFVEVSTSDGALR